MSRRATGHAIPCSLQSSDTRTKHRNSRRATKTQPHARRAGGHGRAGPASSFSIAPRRPQATPATCTSSVGSRPGTRPRRLQRRPNTSCLPVSVALRQVLALSGAGQPQPQPQLQSQPQPQPGAASPPVPPLPPGSPPAPPVRDEAPGQAAKGPGEPGGAGREAAGHRAPRAGSVREPGLRKREANKQGGKKINPRAKQDKSRQLRVLLRAEHPPARS